MQKITLPEAIRLGAMMNPKANWYEKPLDHGDIGTCALGGAMKATGKKKLIDLIAEYPELLSYSVRPPEHCSLCSDEAEPLLDIIQHLNDEHGWSREQIADWLDTLNLYTMDQPQDQVETNVT